MNDLPIYRVEFLESLSVSQRLVDFLSEHLDPKGVILISQSETARRLGYSQTRISQLYSRLGLSDPCIEKMSYGKYRLNYKNLSDRGLYKTLSMCIDKIERFSSGRITQDSEFPWYNNRLKAAFLGINIKEVQILDGFINSIFSGSPRGKVNRYISVDDRETLVKHFLKNVVVKHP